MLVSSVIQMGKKMINEMIWKNLTIWSILAMSTSICFGQGKTESANGKVTFITSNSVYVKFDDTESITLGDTLQLNIENTLSPCLIVKNKSSTSCVCSIINSCDVKINDQVVPQSKVETQEMSAKEEDKQSKTPPSQVELIGKPKGSETIHGSISAASYSNISSARDNTHRTMYRLSLNASRINNSKFSVETFMNYRQNFISNESTSQQRKNAFYIYNLAIRYDIDSTFSILVGRKVNRNASSLGAIDGVQGEKFFGNFYTGVIAGFRPDILNYGFNSDLLQYGAYIGMKTDGRLIYSQTTLGLLEQKNGGKVDRRYSYFQHSSTINQNLTLFSSFEIDLYNRVNGVVSSSARLTNIYVSAGYRINRKLNFYLSYDSRKQVLFYETLKTQIEQILDDDIARQGLRFRVNARPYKYVSAGISYSKRFQSNSLNESNNMNGFISLSKIPSIGGRLSANFNRNLSSYMDSRVLSVRHSRMLIENKLDADFYIRVVNYSYVNREISNIVQEYYGTSLTYNIGKKLALSVLGELATRDLENNYRINTRIIKRF